jgi:hypothetical protein
MMENDMSQAVIAATLGAPTGILTAIDKAAAARGMTHAQLLTKAGLVQGDWDAINTALASITTANWFLPHNAAGVQTAVILPTQAILEGAAGAVSSLPQGEVAAARFGNDLT